MYYSSCYFVISRNTDLTLTQYFINTRSDLKPNSSVLGNPIDPPQSCFMAV